MSRHAVSCGVLAVVAVACGHGRSNVRIGSLDPKPRSIDYKPGIVRWTLRNGLAVAMVPDDRANLVTVDVRYRVGSADDPPGKTGLAHLVEHLMFEQRAAPGGPTLSDQLVHASLHYNAYTTFDTTHYDEVGLADQLDALLAIEARRMAATCAGLDEATFRRERAVVAQEEAQRGHGRLTEPLHAAIFGPGHGYNHTAGGHDIAQLTLSDACHFIDDHYAPGNAILVIGGRIPGATVHAVATQFGAISHTGVAPAATVGAAAWTGQVSDLMLDVDDPTVVVAFPSAAWGTVEWLYDRLIDGIIVSRLQQLAHRVDWIRSVEVLPVGGNRGGGRAFALRLTSADRADAAIAEVFTAAHDVPGRYDDDLILMLAAAAQRDVLDASEAIDERGARIADFLQFTDHGKFQLRLLTELQHLELTTLRERARRLVRDASRIVRIAPDPAHRHAGGSVAGGAPIVDTPVWQAEVDPAEAERPIALGAEPAASRVIDRALGNGLRLVMLPGFREPAFDARLVFPISEPALPDAERGVATAAAQLLSHDLRRSFAPRERQVIEWVLHLGSPVYSKLFDHTTFGVRGFSLFADCHLWRLNWLLENGIYDAVEVKHFQERVARGQAVDRDRQRRLALSQALYGADHPYAQATRPVDAVLAAHGLDADRLAGFRERYYRAPGATLVLVGNFDPAVLGARATELLGAWPHDAAPAAAAVPPAHPVAGPTWVADTDADATQVRITVGFAATSPRDASRGARWIAAQMVRDRADQLRQRLGASYGMEAYYRQRPAGDALEVDGFVDAARAGDALRALRTGLDALRAGGPALAADFVLARRAALTRALADPERASAAADALETAIANGLPLDDAQRMPRAIAATTLTAAERVLAADLAPERMVIVLKGPKAAIDAALAAAGATATRSVVEDSARPGRSAP